MSALPVDISKRITNLASNPGDDQDTQLRKTALVITSLMILVAAIIWSIIYIRYGELSAGAIPLTYSLLSLLSLIWLTRHNFRLYLYSQLALILVLPFALMINLGGYVSASAVILWSLIAPLGALIFTSRKTAVQLMALYSSLLIIGGLLEPFIQGGNNMPQGLITFFFVLNLGTVSLVAFVLLAYFVHEKDRFFFLLGLEKERSEALLLNMLPVAIAAILKKEQRVIADHYDSASILFADMAGFTKLSEKLQPQEMVTLLNDIFGRFDTLVEAHGLEKIRTIGDNYMVAAGLPKVRSDHAVALVGLALEMQDYLNQRPSLNGQKPAFRIGINSGPVIAGVIGHKKYQYDIWGDTVNVASRMESHGLPGEIQITQATYELVKDQYHCQPRGSIPVKGKGEMATWQVVKQRS